MKINEKGHMTVGGCDCVELRERFGTPLYVFDEEKIRAMMGLYRETLAEYGEGKVYYASKAFSCKAIYAIAKQEKIGADVVSGGELYTALSAGFPAEDICMHGNNKLPREIEEAVESGVGRIVVDSLSEAELIEEAAKARGKVQKVLLRINPGVEAHTHAYVQTATPDSKFGFSVADGSAKEAAKRLLELKHLRLTGFHYHIGSQIFEKESFAVAAEKALAFAAEMKRAFGFETEELNAGGGFGIWYAEGDPALGEEDYRAFLRALFGAVTAGCGRYGLKKPRLMIEPGRSVGAEAGVTLYTVGAIREIRGVRKYLAVDGGMFDNPRFCLYRSKYTAVLANRAGEKPEELVSVAGKCCESGDLIGVDMNLPKANRGDLLAVLSTGAYNYSMASNYNRNAVPPVVFVKNGEARLVVKGQTYEDIARNDLLPEDL